MGVRTAAAVGVPLAIVLSCGGSGARQPDAEVTLAPRSAATGATLTTAPPPVACADGLVLDPRNRACITACGAQPAYPQPTVEPTCTEVTLRNGDHWHDQLTLQLSSGATTRIDCPRMRFRGQDTPVCVARVIAGQMRGACCPPGHTDPTDPECVAEGSVDEMYKRKRVWEWCSKTEPLPRPCEPCVWVPGAER